MGTVTVTDAGNITGGFGIQSGSDVRVSPDSLMPILESISPADGTTDIAPGSNIVLTFNEPMQPLASLGFAHIVFFGFDEAGNQVAQFSIDANDASQATFSGDMLTINPTADLLSGTRYEVRIEAGILKDSSGNPFPVQTSTTFDFTTAYTTAPTLLAASPVDGSTNIALQPHITLSYNQLMSAGSGNIEIHNASNGDLVASIPVSDSSKVAITDNLVTINVPLALAAGAGYYVSMASGVLQDSSGIAAPAISSGSAPHFTTAPDGADRTQPVLISTSPSNGSTSVSPGAADIVLTFNEPVMAGTGNISIDIGGFLPTTLSLPISNPDFTIVGNTLTIDGFLLGAGDGYSISLPFGVIQDVNGNAFAGGSMAFTVSGVDLGSGVGAIDDHAPSPGVTLVAGDLPLDMTAWNAAQIGAGAIALRGLDEVDIAGNSNSGTAPTYRLMGNFTISGGTPAGKVKEVDVTGTADGVQHFLYSISDLTPVNSFGSSGVQYSTFLSAANGGNAAYDAAVFWAGDTLIGGPANDVLEGFAGDDKIIGGAGIDSAVFSGNRSAYTITANGSVTVSGPDGNDTLKGIEKAAFDDQTVLLGQGPLSTDFNTDLNSDILWQSDSGQAAIWTMNGLAQLGGSPVGGNPGASWHVKGAGDFNGDGSADILWQNDNGQAAIWTMNGLTQIGGGPVGGNPGTSWHIKGTGDFNGDGKADILWQNDSGQAAIWLMDGLNQLGAVPVGGNPGPTWHVMGTGDFNGDGKSDILWQNDSGQAEIWLMDGVNQIAGAPVGGNPGASWHIRGAGDFNGDGKADILWQNDNGQAAIWTMDGLTQTGGSPVGGNPGSSWHVMGAGDFNGDGKADILWQNDNGQAAVWTMNGFTQLGASPVGGNPGNTWHVIATGT